MPSVIYPRLLHILCDDNDYEQSLLQNTDSTSNVETFGTSLKVGSSDADGYLTSFDVTTYETYRLHLLGNYHQSQKTTTPTEHPTLTQRIHDHDCKQFFDLGFKDSVINTLCYSTNVINWMTLDKLLLLHKANIQSVFVNLGAIDKL